MNLDEQKVTGTNQVSVTDSLEAPLLSIKVSRTASTSVPTTTDLIVYVDTAPKTTPTSNRKQFVFELTSALGYASSTSDQFVLEVVPKGNDIVADAYVTRKVSGTSVLSTPTKEVLDESLINLFEGTNYIYTNYTNDTIEIIYPKDDELNRRYLNNAIFCHHRQNSSGDFSLDDIYFKDAFTKTEDKLNLEADNAKIASISSKNNAFSLDEDGNLIVNSITTSAGSNSLISNSALCNLIYPVGSIYMSVNSINPTTLFGGTWEQITDKFLLAAGNSYTAGNTGGAEIANISHTHTTGDCTLTVSQIPSHSHNQKTIGEDGNINPWVANRTGSSQGVYSRQQVAWYNSGKQNVATFGTGGGAAHNHGSTGSGGSTTLSIMPPYLVVYIWKRTA